MNRQVRTALATTVAGAVVFIGGATPASAAWKLQAPGANSITEIGPDQLADYESRWFQRTAKGIVLTSPTEGATTPNSKNNRTELREMASDGAEAAWDPAKGTHKFAVRLAVTRLPKTEPVVVVAQIHDGADDRVTMRLEGQHLFVAGDESNPLASLTGSYRLGTPFTVAFAVRGGHVDVVYNGRCVDAGSIPAGATYFFKTGRTSSPTSRGTASRRSSSSRGPG